MDAVKLILRCNAAIDRRGRRSRVSRKESVGVARLVVRSLTADASVVRVHAGGYFKIRFQFGSDFPNQPPKCETSCLYVPFPRCGS